MKTIKTILILGLFIVGFNACKSDDPAPKVAPSISNLTIDSITQVSAYVKAEITGLGSYGADEVGFCLSASMNPDTSDIKYEVTGPFALNDLVEFRVNDLDLGQTYYVRAYAMSNAGLSYSEEVSFTTLSTLALGLKYGGGYIIYLDPTNEHGLIAADTLMLQYWGCKGTSIAGAKGTDIGTGQANTTAIKNACTSSAAWWCDRLSYKGYDDWFLPSLDEATLIYTNLGSKGIRQEIFYNHHIWTSTEMDRDFGRTVRLGDGGNQGQGKASPGKAIPVRDF